MALENLAPMKVLLVGEDDALLEGLAQTFAAQGYAPRVVGSLADARHLATRDTPLLAVVDRALAAAAGPDALAIPLLPGGALMLYQVSDAANAPVSPTLQRSVLAELTLPLERKRLLALAQYVSDRVIATGRTHRPTPPEQRAV